VPSSHELRQRYSRLSDNKIMELAVREAGGLTVEAIEVLREQIRTRNLDHNLEKSIQAQRREWSDSDQAELLDEFRDLPCPICQSTEHKLNGFTIKKIKSFVLYGIRSSEFVVGCPHCISAKAESASKVTRLLGWWVLPLGVNWTIEALENNSKVRKHSSDMDPSDELRAYVEANLGEVVLLTRST